MSNPLGAEFAKLITAPMNSRDFIYQVFEANLRAFKKLVPSLLIIGGATMDKGDMIYCRLELDALTDKECIDGVITKAVNNDAETLGLLMEGTHACKPYVVMVTVKADGIQAKRFAIADDENDALELVGELEAFDMPALPLTDRMHKALAALNP